MKSGMKYFEVRDRATRIAVAAWRPAPGSEQERWLLGTVGLGCSTQCVVTRLDTLETHIDPALWSDPRPMCDCHAVIAQAFDDLRSGAVIDWRVINGEADHPVPSDRWFDWELGPGSSM